LLRFLHLSDLHLGWRPRFMAEDEAKRVQAERDRVLEQAVAYALDPEHQIDLIIIAGDLFETHQPEPGLTERVIQALTRCTNTGKQVITVPGNHDEITYRDSVYRREQERWPGILVSNPMPELVAQLEIGGQQVYVYSLAYIGGITQTKPPVKDFPRVEGDGFHLGVFHGSYNWDAGDRSLPLDPDALTKAGYDYVALGHFHVHQTHQIGRGLAVYPGMIAGKGFHDPGLGELLIGEWQRPHQVKLHKVPVGAPLFERYVIDVSTFSDWAQLASLLESRGNQETMVRVELQGITGFPIDVDRLLKRTQSYYRYLEIVNHSYYLSDSQLELMSQEKTITGFFLAEIKERLSKAGSPEEKDLLNRALTHGMLALKGGNQDA
jgi:exonuclease SbcD